MQSPKQEQRRINYKLEIRRLLALGLTTEAISRILREKYSTSRTTFYEYLRQIRQEDNVLAEAKDSRYIHTDINICRDRLSTLYRNALSKIQDPNTNQFVLAPLLKLAQDIAITLLKLEFEGVQVTQILNSKLAEAEPILSLDESGVQNSDDNVSNSVMSNPHQNEDDVFLKRNRFALSSCLSTSQGKRVNSSINGFHHSIVNAWKSQILRNRATPKFKICVLNTPEER